MRKNSRVSGTVILLALALPAATALAEKVPLPSVHSAGCQVPENVAWSGPIANSALLPPSSRSGQKIVALGSSSTAGAGASRPENGYVAQFGRALETQAGGRRIQIINAGVNGNTTADMLRRLGPDVLDRRPAVVIWQTGTNDALRQIPIEQFRRDLTRGLEEMKARGIKVILIDQQDFGRALAVKNYAAYVSTMQDVAKEENVTLLRRYRVMGYLALQHRGGMPELLANDRLHMNDEAHRCVGELLAEGINRLLR